MDLPPTFFDHPRWLASRIGTVGGRVACDETIILFGRAMFRAFAAFCLPPVRGDDDDDDDLERALANNPVRSADARDDFARLLRAPALFWL